MPPAPHLTSSVGLLAMLEEEEKEIKAHALRQLDRVVPDFWAEISESLPDIESLYEDDEFPQRQLAALVASKVYYYLGALPPHPHRRLYAHASGQRIGDRASQGRSRATTGCEPSCRSAGTAGSSRVSCALRPPLAGELGDALIFALGAGKLFRVDEGSEYVDTLIAKAIDEYCLLYQKRCAAY